MRIAPTKLYAKYCCFVCVCSGTQRVSCQRTDNKPLQGDMASSHLTGQTNTGRWSRHIFQENISYLFIVIMFHENCTQLQRSPLKSSPFRPPHRNRPSQHPPPQIQPSTDPDKTDSQETFPSCHQKTAVPAPQKASSPRQQLLHKHAHGTQDRYQRHLPKKRQKPPMTT